MIKVQGETRELGVFVLKRRLALGLTQRELARRLGWEQPEVSKLETGKIVGWPNSIALANLARAIECAEWELWEAGGYNVDCDKRAGIR